MIEDENTSLIKLKKEWDAVEAKTSADLFEHIGNSLCRINLASLVCGSIKAETVNRFFVETANSIHGSISGLEQKLKVLVECSKAGRLPYPAKAVIEYLKSWGKAGYPALSHSRKYRETYSPAYRVVNEKYCRYFRVFQEIDRLKKERDRVIIAIDGNSGAGKSSLAALLADIYRCGVFHMDDFFLPREMKTAERLAEVGGNVDYLRFRKEILEGINSGMEFRYRRYDCSKGAFAEPITATPGMLHIVEGCYSMHPELIGYYDLKIFLSIDREEQKKRILQRNGAAMLERYVNEWIPLEDKYFTELKKRKLR